MIKYKYNAVMINGEVHLILESKLDKELVIEVSHPNPRIFTKLVTGCGISQDEIKDNWEEALQKAETLSMD